MRRLTMGSPATEWSYASCVVMHATVSTDPAPTINDRPYRDAPLADLAEQIEFAYSDGKVPDYYVLDELVRRARLAENQR